MRTDEMDPRRGSHGRVPGANTGIGDTNEGTGTLQPTDDIGTGGTGSGVGGTTDIGKGLGHTRTGMTGVGGTRGSGSGTGHLDDVGPTGSTGGSGGLGS